MLSDKRVTAYAIASSAAGVSHRISFIVSSPDYVCCYGRTKEPDRSMMTIGYNLGNSSPGWAEFDHLCIPAGFHTPDVAPWFDRWVNGLGLIV